MLKEAPAVDVLVANAGLPASGTIDDYSVEEIDRALDVNLRAPIILARSMLRGMVSRGGGHLVFVSSLSGKFTAPGSALYSATKFGLRGMAGSLRQDLDGTGVGVSTIFPGPIRESGMWADTRMRTPTGVGTRSPRDVARAVVRAIEKDAAEIAVATPSARLGSVIAQIAPSVTAGFNRRIGLKGRVAQVAEAQRKRR